MDQNYRIVKTVESSGAGASSDMHEFKMTPFTNGTTALMTVYQPRQYDLTTNPRYNVEHGMGWIVESVFQEVEIETGTVLFEWRSLDHVDPGLSWTMPGTTDTSGDGLHEQRPWDYFHINSIDKNIEGDYLISARHVSAIYKLSGKDGHIMWQMGGNAATITTTNFVFSYQHHARWMSENSTHTVLTFYDNASNNYNHTGKFSHGWTILIDHLAATATMIQEYSAPEAAGGMLSGSQGNMQVLPNGNVHIGWGEHAHFSEHTAEGSVVQYGILAERASAVMIYRSNKYNWTAQPLTKPALWTYSRTGDKMAFYVSWNGATEVQSWNFYASENSMGPWKFVGQTRKHGFETELHMPGAMQWAYAEALDKDARPLETSVIAKTFRPSASLVQFCDDRGCSRSEKAKNSTSYETNVVIEAEYLSPNRGFNTSQYYEDLDAKRPSGPTSGSKKHIGEPSVGSGPDIGLSIALVLGGLLAGVAMSVLGLCLHAQGALRALEPVADTLQQRTMRVSDRFSKSAYGSKLLGRYSRVREKEMDGSESGSSSSMSMLGSGAFA